MGSHVIEKEHASKYREFKKFVQTRTVRFWKDLKDIKIAIFETLNDFSRRENLVGWVLGNQQVDTSRMTSQILSLSQTNSTLNSIIEKQKQDNDDLKNRIAELENVTKTITYKNLNAKSRGLSQRAKINGQEVTLQTTEYPNGTLGEISINMPKESVVVRSLLESVSVAVSLGLQYGVPLEEFVDKFVFTRFDPSGFVEHPNLKSTTSILDLVFRLIGYEYLGRTDFVHVLDKPEILNTGADDWDEIPSNGLDVC